MGGHRPLFSRFVPTCTPELMGQLDELAERYDVPVQSHLSENLYEIELVKQLHPEERRTATCTAATACSGSNPPSWRTAST